MGAKRLMISLLAGRLCPVGRVILLEMASAVGLQMRARGKSRGRRRGTGVKMMLECFDEPDVT